MSGSPSHHSRVTPNFPVYWDSTMLGTLKECPARFHYQHLLGYQPRGLSIHLFFGQLLHSGLEQYDHARAEGQSHDAATLTMVHWALAASGSRDADGLFLPWTPDPENPNSSIKNRVTLIRSLIWTVEDHKDSPLETVILQNGKPAVELSFRFPAFDVGGEAITLCGHLDKLVKYESSIYVKDWKTTKGALNSLFFNQFTPNNQMSLYTIAGKVILDKPIAGVLIGGIQIGVNFTRSASRPIPRPPAVLTEWLADAQWWIARAREFAIEGHWPLNDKSCGNYGGCPFQRVCAVSPSARPMWLSEDFAKFTWNPLEIRGDV